MNGNNMIILGSHDDEEFTTNSINRNGHEALFKSISYKSLCEYSIERCEFCDKVSKNRYSSIVHNTRHIIIPLINQKVSQCLECRYHFTSVNALNHHILTKHERITKTVTSKQILVNTEPIDVDDYEPVSKKLNRDSKILNHDSKMKNRLLFEEDVLDADITLMDFTTDCKVNIELFEAPRFETEQEVVGKSVGFYELMRPGVYKCKKCSKRFPNRYESIIHETTHLSLEKCIVQLCSICNKYIAGDATALHLHNTTNHNHKPTNKCHKCGTTYTDLEKHKIYCPMNTFDYTENKFVERSKLIKLCEMCFSFCKSTPLKQYVCVDICSKLGKRFACDRCGSLFFEVKVVERRLRCKEKDKEKDEKRRKVLSNEDRLKNIVHRLKTLK